LQDERIDLPSVASVSRIIAKNAATLYQAFHSEILLAFISHIDSPPTPYGLFINTKQVYNNNQEEGFVRNRDVLVQFCDNTRGDGSRKRLDSALLKLPFDDPQAKRTIFSRIHYVASRKTRQVFLA
jgi:hypothetical protein